MDKFAQKPTETLKDVFSETANRIGATPQIAEKDFWVIWVLKRLFEDAELGSSLTFKGGTSLSKAYGLINRFSEDVDLVLDWGPLLEEDPWESRSKTQQDKVNWRILERAKEKLRESLLPRIEFVMKGVCAAEIDPNDSHSILVRYPASFSGEYIRPEIKLEIGPLAAKEPSEEREIQSYAAEEFPDLFSEPSCLVRVIRAERTFWEKATILHQEAHRPDDKPQPRGYSRHYYDMYMMANHAVGANALQELALLSDVVEFKKKYYPRAWARYDLAAPRTLRLIPAESIQKSLREDYRDMRNMLFGDIPSFDEILARLEELEQEIS